jgi:16S rRNA U1498 N3-methylase RsmE
MARERRRLLIPATRLTQAASGVDPQTPGALLTLEPAERHYLQRVLRLRQGDQVALVDGQGGLWTARLEEGSLLRLEQPLAAPLRRAPAPTPPLELALALPRRDVELVWRMATELGIDRLRPLRAARCVVPGQPPLERWNSVITEACEQCERLWRPELLAPVEALPWLAETQSLPWSPRAEAGAGVLQGLGAQSLGAQGAGPQDRGPQGAPPDDSGLQDIRPQRGEPRDGSPHDPGPQDRDPQGDEREDDRLRVAPSLPGPRLFATTRDGSLPSLASALAEASVTAPHNPHGAVTVAIGPEGGWTAEEQAAALDAGWRAVSLGPLILRSSTAAVAAAALLTAWRQGGSHSMGWNPERQTPER